MQTRSQTWFLATLTPTIGGGFTLEQRPCRVEIAPVLGVSVRMDPAAVPRLPAAVATFQRQPDGSFGAPGWTAGWDAEDVDGDGHPGLTLAVDAPLCGGRLYVASQSTTRARLRAHDGALEARIAVQVEQRVLGADGACLKATAADETQALTGWFRLVPVPPGTTCPTDPARWPALPGVPR
ncbi:MAG: hypothetical protein R3F60_24030 [bacterium]